MPRLLRSALPFGVLAALAVLLLAPPARAQFPGAQWEDTFAVPGLRDLIQEGNLTPRTTLLAMVQRGSDLYVGGLFRGIDDLLTPGIAHWDGTAWRPLGGGVTSADSIGLPYVSALAFAPDGSLYVGGQFTHAIQPDGTPLLTRGVARWDGTQWHPVGGGTVDHGGISELVVEPGGTLVAAGSTFGFIQSDGSVTEPATVARWTGSAWVPLAGLWGGVSALTLSPTGALVAAGNIDHVNMPDGTFEPGDGIYTWDGTAWRALVPGPGGNGTSALLYVGTDLYVGGQSRQLPLPDGATFYSGGVARWDGTRWHPMAQGLHYGASRRVSVLVQDGASILAGGDFEAFYRGDELVEVGGMARWNGAAWEPAGYEPVARYTFEWSGFERPVVRALLRAPDGTVFFGGSFGDAHGADGRFVPARGLARHGAGGLSAVSARTAPQGLGGPRPMVSALARSACGPLLVGGTFSGSGPRLAGGVAAWEDGAWEPAYSPPTPAPPGNYGAGVLDVTPADCVGGSGRFFVAGSLLHMRQPDGTAIPLQAARIARWDGARWTALGGGFQGNDLPLALLPDGDGVYVAGRLDLTALQTDGTPVPGNGLLHWSPGAGWAPVAGLANPESNDDAAGALLRLPDGSIVVAGTFRAVRQPDGTVLPAGNVARWDGAAWHTFGGPRFVLPGTPPVFLPAAIYALALDAAGRLIVGGHFNEVVNPDGTVVPALNVAAWDGTAWTAPGGGLDDLAVAALAVDAHGRLFAGGSPIFDLPSILYVWDGATWTPVPGAERSDLTLSVAALTFDDDGRLYVGGAFMEFGGVPSPGLAVWNDPALTPAEPGAPDSPDALALAVAPNPAQGRASLRFTLPAAADVRLAVYDALGREVAVLADAALPAGTHEVALDVGRLAPGVYVARLTTGAETAVRRLTVVR